MLKIIFNINITYLFTNLEILKYNIESNTNINYFFTFAYFSCTQPIICLDIFPRNNIICIEI